MGGKGFKQSAARPVSFCAALVLILTVCGSTAALASECAEAVQGTLKDGTYAWNTDLPDDKLSATFRGEPVSEIYALNADQYTTVKYYPSFSESAFLEQRFLELLSEAPTGNASAKKAFIVFTDKQRYYIYLSGKAQDELKSIWQTIYDEERSNKNIHWLTHMTTDRITKIHGVKRGTEKNNKIIAEIADFLKNSLVVDDTKKIRIFEGPSNPVTVCGLYMVSISFDSGVWYSMIGYGDYGSIQEGGTFISLYTSDLNKTITYPLKEGNAAHLRYFLENID